MHALMANLLISSLTPGSREKILTRATSLPLPVDTVLYESEITPGYAYFMLSGIASVVTTVAKGATAEVGVIGHEGLAGSLHLLGPALVPTRCFMQMDGTGLRIPLADLQEIFQTSVEVRGRILEFVQEQALSLSQIAGCHRLHESEERLARWLLMVQDRTETETLKLTQEFLAQMLGSQRTTVTAAAGAMQRRGLIEYRHGQVKITDRSGLEAAACDCYQIIKGLYQSLYQPRTRPTA